MTVFNNQPMIAPARPASKVVSLQSFLLLIGVALLPVYVFPSGSAQPAHIVLAAFAALTLLNSGFRFVSWNLLLILLAVHALLIELVYSGEYGLDGLINPVFFFYNVFIPYAIYRFVAANGERPVTIGLIAASVLAVASVLYFGVQLEGDTVSGRSTGGFNNPNQLGYFSVCLLSLAYVLYVRRQVGTVIALGLFVASTFLSIASLSKAAMVANFLVLFIVVRPIITRRSAVMWFGFVIIAVFAVVYLLQSGALDQFYFFQRLNDMFDEGDSSLASRGYLVFLEGDPMQVMFGLGSGHVLEILEHEVHSTFFAVLSNYGLVGLALFGGVMVVWAKSLWREYGLIGVICIAGPSILYGITHNGTRFTIFWLLFAVSIVRHSSQKANRAPAGAQAIAPPPRGAIA